MLSVLLLATAIAADQASAASGFPRELIANAQFERRESNRDWPADWPRAAGVTWQTEAENHFLRFQVTKSGSSASISRSLPLDPAWGTLRVACRVRYDNIVAGKEGWHDGRIAMSFVDAKGQRVGPWPNVLHWRGTARDWAAEQRDFAIPEGAKSLALSLALYSVDSGTLDLDDVHVTVLRPRPQPADTELPPSWKAATQPALLQRGPREVLSLNGAWQFRPMGIHSDEPKQFETKLLSSPPPLPHTVGWGWTKLPAVWPETTGDAHAPGMPEFWSARLPLHSASAYWYRRRVDIPANWNGKRIVLEIDLPQTQAAVLVAGKPTGVIRWPGGSLDLSAQAKPGQPLELAFFVTAQPFSAEQLSVAREDLITKSKAVVRFHGLCGDLRLVAEPRGPRMVDVQYRPSLRKKQLGLSLRLAGATAPVQVRFSAAIAGKTETQWTSPPQTVDATGRVDLNIPWLAARLWDLDQPNLYQTTVQVLSAAGEVLDQRNLRMGFREFWIEGRDLVLNGQPIHWRALCFSNHQRNLFAASKQGAAETFARMRALGFNFVLLGNYGFDPGDTLSFDGLLEAADESGFLLSFALPHPFRSNAGWNSKYYQSDLWKSLTSHCVGIAQNHPCVLAYAMSHNTLGYFGDQNPAKIDGVYQPELKPEVQQRRVAAAEAEAFVRQLDPSREVYHHQSGNMGHWHTVNIYLNWSPIQERMEWLSHWAEAGVKPVFFVEWGLPHQASWGRHRQGPFIWRNNVSSEPLAIEYGAMNRGPSAYNLTPDEQRHIDRYERVYAKGEPFHITQVLGDYWQEAREHNFIEIKSDYTKKVWPALRTWGISALLPWDQADMARRVRPPAERKATVLASDPAASTQPGLHPDVRVPDSDYFITGDADSFELTSLGKTFQRVNADVLMWIAGDPKVFCDQSQNYYVGESVTKQVIVVNDRRTPLVARLTAGVSQRDKTLGEGDVTLRIPPGGQQRVPIRWQAFEGGNPIWAMLTPTGGSEPLDEQEVVKGYPRTKATDTAALTAALAVKSVALWDPKGLTTKELAKLNVHLPAFDPASKRPIEGLVVGREAITVDGALPDLRALAARGLKHVLVFEQTQQALTQRLGFRTNTLNARSVFTTRIDDNVKVEFNDWRGKSTLEPERFDLPSTETSDPKVDWLGFHNTRVWKWGNRGQVATVGIEMPQRGEAIPLLLAGFDLQYATVLMMRAGAGLEFHFCQMDVTNRTEDDPMAQETLRSIIEWASVHITFLPPHRTAVYYGGQATLDFLKSLGARVTRAGGQPAPSSSVALIGPDAAPDDVRAALRASPDILLLAPSEAILKVFGDQIKVFHDKLTHDSLDDSQSYLDKAEKAWPRLVGITASDLHFRGRTELLTIAVHGDGGWTSAAGTLAGWKTGNCRVACCTIDPRQFDYQKPNRIYLKLTHNHACSLWAKLLANAGVALDSRLEEYWQTPVTATEAAKRGRWLDSYYLDTPVADDDPYRYNRW